MATTVLKAETIGDAGSALALTLTRAVYTGAYFVSYGVVFPVVYMAYALPRQNATMRGLYDGGVAAMDALAGRK